MDAPVVLALDGNSLVHRSFHALSQTGHRSWAVRGLLTQLLAAVDRIRPAVVVVGFDDPFRSVRRERWPSYKAHRADKPAELVEQLTTAVAVMRQLGVAVVVPDGLEADDVLASTASAARDLGANTVVVTSDRDAFALIDEHTRVLRIINGGVDASPVLTPDRLVTLVGVRPEQYRDFAALRGDPSDNLPGVRGIGPTTAARLLAEFGGAATAFDDLDGVRTRVGAGVAARLAHPDARPAWERNCRVMALENRIPLHLALDDGPGSLPLLPAAVEAVFGAQGLLWSMGLAADVLAEVHRVPGQAPAATVVGPEERSAPVPATATAHTSTAPEPELQLALF